MNSNPDRASFEELLHENAVLREEVRVARRASDITARLVVEQFVKTEEILHRLEDKARAEAELGRQLGEQLQEAEQRKDALTRERTQLQEMQVVTINMMEDVAAARRAAEEAARVKAEFLANMSHEIRTPMTAILGYIDLMGEGCPNQCDFSRSERRRHLEIISRNARHLLDIINGILDLSKIEAGKLILEQVICAPAQLIADVLSLMRVRAGEKHLELEAQFVGPIPETIRSDATRIKQILINLTGNAIKFTERGKVSLVARCERIETNDGNDSRRYRMIFEVRDTGIGITPNKIDLIFLPFAQADASTTRKYGGTGLGLIISKRLAGLLGGDIEVESVVGEGSVFRFWFETELAADAVWLENPPLTIRKRSEMQPYESSAAPEQVNCRILLAEDGPDNQRLITAFLKKMGATVELAENGRMAVEKITEASAAGRDFDIILMDMQMPELDGYQATQILRSCDYAGTIIALTAHAMTQDRQKCIDAGCDDYLTKPIDRRLLISTIRRWLNSDRQPNSENACGATQ